MTDSPDQVQLLIDHCAQQESRETIVEDSRNLLRLCKRFRKASLKAKLGWTNLPDSVIAFVFRNCENPINTVRYVCLDLLTEAFEFHTENCKFKGNECEWLKCVAEMISNLPSHLKMKYSFYTSMLKNVSFSFSKTLINPNDITGWLKDRSLVASLTELFCTYVNKAAISEDSTVRNILASLLVAIQNQKSTEADYISRNVIPGILKYCPSEAVDILMEELLNSISLGTRSEVSFLRALLQCLSCTLPTRLLRTPTLSLGDVIGSKLLLESLCHGDSEVRTSAFRLLCDHPKSTAAMSESNLLSCRWYLTMNFNTPSSAFRQSMIATIRRLFGRLRDSGNQLVKLRMKGESPVHQNKISQEFFTKELQEDQENQEETETEELKCYEEFLHWIHSEAFRCLTFGSNNARVSSGLATLLAFYEIFTPESTIWLSQINLPNLINQSTLLHLINILTDSYGENQQDALKIFNLLPKSIVHSILEPKLLEALAIWALDSVSSTKPQATEAAAVMFLFLCHCNSVALPPVWNVSIINPESLMRVLLTVVEKHIVAVSRNLFEVVRNSPIFGALHCLSILLRHTANAVTKQELWETFGASGNDLGRIVDLCCKAGSLVGPVINSSSPEGHLPMDIVDISGTNVSSANGDSTAIGSAECQSLLVSCWRTQKEISAIFATLASVLVDLDDCTSQLSLILRMSNSFLTQLSECKHRGAFETTYASFVDFCTSLWRCPCEAVRELPADWLKKILLDVRDDQIDLCATRRSAGLPFLVEAIVSTEPLEFGSDNFQSCMATLTEMAVDRRAEVVEPKIHAFNILRAIYRVSRLGKLVTPYVTDGVKAAILGLSHAHWSVRNSATLLFGALVTRMFGVPRAKDGSDKKTSLAISEFCSMYPDLPPFLVSQLHEYLKPDKTRTSEFSLFPVLLLLTKLRPVYSATDTDGSGDFLLKFVPAVLRIAVSASVLKIRSLAARALVSIVPQSEQPRLILTLSNAFEQQKVVSESAKHGILLILKAILDDRTWPNAQMELFSNEAVLNGFKAIMTGCLRSPCPVILSCVADNCNIVSSSGLKMTDVLDDFSIDTIVNGMWLRHPINSYAFSSISKLSCNLSRHGQLWESEEDASLKRELMSAAVHLSDKSFRGFVKSYFGLDPFQQLADMLSNNKDEKLIRKICKVAKKLISQIDVHHNSMSHLAFAEMVRSTLIVILQEKTRVTLIGCLLDMSMKFSDCSVIPDKAVMLEYLSDFANPNASRPVRMVAVSLLDKLLQKPTYTLRDVWIPAVRLLLDEDTEIRDKCAEVTGLRLGLTIVICPQLALDILLQSCLLEGTVPVFLSGFRYLIEMTDEYFEMGSRRNCSNGGIFEKNELKIYSELPVFMEMIVFYICIASGSLTADGGGDFTCFSDGNFKFCRLWTYQKALGVLSTSDLLCDKVTSQKIQFHSDRIEELPAFLDLLRLCGNRIEVLTDYLITVDPLIGGLEDSLEILCLKVYSTTSLSLTRLLVAIYEEIHTNDKDWWMSSSYGRLLCSSLAKLKRLRLGEKKEKFDGITTDCCEVLGEFFTAGIPLLSALQWGFNQE